MACWLLGLATALSASASANPEDPRIWRISAELGAAHQFEGSLDSGGDFEVTYYAARLGASRVFAERLRAGLSVGYGEDHYSFTNGNIAGNAPWSDIRDLRVGAPLQYRTEGRWTLFAIPTLRFAAEKRADLEDGRYGGILGGASYRFSERLSLGPGFGIFSEIEDDTSLFPVLLIDWKISDGLRLETGRGFAASRGPGIALNWTPDAHWTLSLGARYESFRFRLDDQGTAPGGVGEKRAFPLFLAAKRRIGADVTLAAIVGAELGGRLRLEDRDGALLSESDYDAAPMAGATLRIDF
jgi:hypothetical protein